MEGVAAMTDLDEQHEQLKGRGGASVIISGAKFGARLERGFWALLGMAVVAGSFTVANNLYNLNMNVGKLVDNNVAVSAQLSDHEIRLRAVEKDVSAIEGKVFRGGFDPLKDPVK